MFFFYSFQPDPTHRCIQGHARVARMTLKVRSRTVRRTFRSFRKAYNKNQSQSKLWTIGLKLKTIEDIYLPSPERSGGAYLNFYTNLLHNTDQLHTFLKDSNAINTYINIYIYIYIYIYIALVSGGRPTSVFYCVSSRACLPGGYLKKYLRSFKR